MRLSVIIVNYNVKYFLEQCLFSVQRACRNIEAEIIVVDNCSTDGSRAYLEPRFPRVNFIWNSSNSGFSKANNLGLTLAQGENILFLNPDTIVPEDCFEKCTNYILSREKHGALGVRMIDGTGHFLKESKRGFPSPRTALYKFLGLAALFPGSKIFSRYYLGNLSEHENHEVDVLAGAFMMAPKHLLDITGGFDELFFMYGEDVDLSYRMQQAGFPNYYFSETTVIHFKGESTKKNSIGHVKLFHKAMSLFVKKHYGTKKAWIFNFLVQAGIFFRAMLTAIVAGVQYFRSLFRKTGNTAADKILVVAGENDFETVLAMIGARELQERVLGRVGHNTGHDNKLLGEIEHLPEIIKKYGAKEIIFCEGETGFREIISVIQELPPGIKTKFHAAGSGSIVGSDDKDHAGEFIGD